jgi:hypothetical protein
MLVTTPALALSDHAYQGSFGSSGAGAGQFDEPSGVAVEEVALGKVGDVYVVDRGNDRVEWFSPEGKELKGEFNGDETPAKSLASPSAIAIDNSTDPLDPSAGDVYVLDSGNHVIDKFEAGGKYVGQITAGAGGEPFGELDGVAVDPEGRVWVYQSSGQIDSYGSELANGFLSSRNSPFGTSPGFAVDGQDNLYVVRGSGAAAKLNSSGQILIEELDNESTSAVAVDTTSGEVFVDNVKSVAAFDSASACTGSPACAQPPAGSMLDRFGSGNLESGVGVAVGAASSYAYVADRSGNAVRVFRPLFLPTSTTDAATSVTTETATLNGTVDPEGVEVSSCEFEYGLTKAYGSREECSAKPGAGSSPVAVSAHLIGLRPGSVYHVRLVARNENGESYGADRSFKAISTAPSVEGESATGIGSTEATVGASIAGRELPTSYRIEYGITAAYGSSTAEVSIGAPSGAVAVSRLLEKLESGVEYHYRFVATNALGSTPGTDMTFKTGVKSISAVTLPDSRAYELVSPPEDTEVYVPNLHQAGLEATGEFSGLIGVGYREQYKEYRASPDGDTVSFVGESPASGVSGSGATGNGDGNQFISHRTGDRWETSDIEIPSSGEEGSPYFQAFSEDLSVYTLASEFPGIVAHPAKPASCKGTTPYSHDSSGYHALVLTPQVPRLCQATGAGISANNAHTLLYTQNALTAHAVEGESYEDKNLYDSVGGALYQVNVLPDGEVEQHPDAWFGGLSFYKNEDYEASFEHAISEDGSRVFWTALEGEGHDVQPKALYVRENDTQPQSPVSAGRCTVAEDACTLQLDKAEAGAEGASGGGRFWAASKDGTKVFFTDCHRLTRGSTADAEQGCAQESSSSETGTDLYEYDFDKPEGERLTDLTVDHNADPLGADVQGVIGASEDGSHVYFVANGVLTSGPNPEGKEPVSGQPNLYFSDAGTTTFVTTLSNEDDSFANLSANGSSGENGGDWHMEPGQRTAEVAPGGNVIGFMSKQSLTGYDNYGSNGYSDTDLPEVFVYAASSGHIFCASCNPSGIPPTPSTEAWEDERNANVGMGGGPLFMPRWVNETGGAQVYFMTNQPLIAQDTNRRQDVYEWESDGSGDCERSAGCASPLSNVSTPAPGSFVAASITGESVFFTQRASLVPTAADEDVKLYDARVDGGFPESSLSCTGTGCQGAPPAPPQYATPASQTFNGIGNYPPTVQSAAKPKPKPLTRAQKLAKALKACKKKPKGRRRSCEKQARKLYGPAKRKGKR